MADHVLAADVGGTKTEIAVGRYEAGRMAISARSRYASQDYPGLDAIIDDFLARLDRSLKIAPGASACFAVAGPVEAGAAKLTNLTWGVNAAELGQHYAFRA
ncbi:MAG TPA: glucokinase, partial [Burkholderiales bacterium]|nr:glucokinase [Burkholderiales bacterium]